MVPRATQRAEVPLMWRTSARVRSHSEGGGGKGPSNMVNQGPSNMVPRATQRAEAPLMWRTSARMRSRATQRAEAPLMRRTSARIRSFPAGATSTTKSLPPCRCFGTRAGLRPRWHFTYVASSDAAHTALGGITTDCSPPGAAILSRLTSGLRYRRHFAYAATSHAASTLPLTPYS